MWDDWRAIEAAQALADREAAEEEGNIIEFPQPAAPAPPEALTEPADGNGQPYWVGVPREPVDDVTGIRLFARLMRHVLDKEERKR